MRVVCVIAVLAHSCASSALSDPDPVADPAAVVVREPVALCHKFALRAIARGEAVIKYGQPIGFAAQAIAAGEHVHTHNLTSAYTVQSAVA